ncbi:MAG: N-acetylmuramic acid 6-phosphate etherase [Nitrospirae bacterium]|nr:N-acetylmuramic acid 6-phosphate etherase [Nitrospirota bacterium]MBF0534566.1 N-acetylmuramic acid 6-phosphate etherase [Nitrospirota bacterium]MBF0617601.1 N-acetylmuramic acid 6-phosphate etherase [Nitrospirota bacterium]
MITENLHPKSKGLDILSADGIFDLMSADNRAVLEAVEAARESICRAIEDAYNTIRGGGTLLYVGAGTSGRLGVLDASEMYPTFSAPPTMIQAVIAGGADALTTPVEGAEDDVMAGCDAVKSIKSNDMVLGITASGTAPYVLSALKEAKRRGAKIWLLTCNDNKCDFCPDSINVVTGPELIAGSTRLKAGTATKIVLNMISTSVMVKLGRVYDGYMVDVVPSNEKLKKRAIKIVSELTNCTTLRASELISASGGNPKTAILMEMKNLSKEDAKSLLDNSGGSLRAALRS